MASAHALPKQFQPLANKPLLAYSLDCFASHPQINQIILVIQEDHAPFVQPLLAAWPEKIKIVYGGATRQISAYHGLRALESHPPTYVHIHDAARPFITHELLDRLHQNLAIDSAYAGLIPAIEMTDTIKTVHENHYIANTCNRHELYAAQTPQYFHYKSILAAHAQAAAITAANFTDDASIAENAKLPVKIINGSTANIKITMIEDMIRAQQLVQKPSPTLPDIRTGHGYDVHGFEPGDYVTLCGLTIPFDKKLAGHSDADVGLHALTDALLATLCAGDIGHHFPPSDPQWHNAPSDIFLRHAYTLLAQAQGHITHVDITLILEAPKIAPYSPAMKTRIAEILQLSPQRISIKATTNEKLGFIGRGEGIAALATATVIFPEQNL